MSWKISGLSHRVGLAEDQLGLVGVGYENVGVWEHNLEGFEIVARSRRRDVEKRHRPGLPRSGEPVGQLVGKQLLEDQEIPNVQHARPALECRV